MTPGTPHLTPLSATWTTLGHFQHAQVLCVIGGAVMGMVGHPMLTTPLLCAFCSFHLLSIPILTVCHHMASPMIYCSLLTQHLIAHWPPLPPDCSHLTIMLTSSPALTADCDASALLANAASLGDCSANLAAGATCTQIADPGHTCTASTCSAEGGVLTAGDCTGE